MPALLAAMAGLSLLIWLFLLFGRRGFWRADRFLPAEAPVPAEGWPAVTAVVPARDEAAVVGDSLAALRAQDYPGRFRVVVVDDDSSDGTAAIAGRVAEGTASSVAVRVIRGAPLPPGWSGKVWALSQGAAHAAGVEPEARYLLLTDADIAHDPASLRRLVAFAEAEDRDLVSLMARLQAPGAWATLLIPAFVFFFQKLYPFPAVADPASRVAGAAGGCLLVRRQALARAGGLEAVRSALIDDCALARSVKDSGGRLWLGLTRTVRSLRPYHGLGDVWRMVARTAYTQLDHRPALLAGTVLAMALTYLVPPLALLALPWHGSAAAAAMGGLAWLAMAFAYRPTLALYERPVWEAPLLPLAALLYTAMTADSALAHWRGAGGRWKGRTQSATAEGSS